MQDKRCPFRWKMKNTLAPSSRKFARRSWSKTQKAGKDVFYGTAFVLHTITRYLTHPRFMPYPAKHVSIRGIEEERYIVVDVSRIGQSGGEPRVLEEVEVSRALFEVWNVDE